jgi:hypothetical protein
MKLHLIHHPEYDQRGFSGWTLSSSDDSTIFQLPSAERLNELLNQNSVRKGLEVRMVSEPIALAETHVLRLSGQLRPSQRECFLQLLAGSVVTC